MEFRILGPLEVLDGQQTVRLGAAKQRALLGVLLLHANEAVSTARLVDELWGERPPATAEKLVQGYVHALRKQLGSDALVTQAPGYKLRLDPRALDLLEFERLTGEARGAELDEAVELRTRALSLWRGAPLADIVLEGPDRHTLGRLSELRLTTQIERIAAELELGRDAQLIGELEALVAEHPYQERLQAQFMLALYRSGRQTEALSAYQTARRALSDELGLQPGQELRDLEAAILRQDEALSLDGRVAPGSPESASLPMAPPPPNRRRRRALLLVPLVGLVAVAAAALALRDEPTPIMASPNSVAVIDPATNDVVATVPTGKLPGPITVGGGSVWVGNLEDKSLTRIDPVSRRVVDTVSLDATPTGVAFVAGSVWVAHGLTGQLSRIDPQLGGVRTFEDVARTGLRSSLGSVAAGTGAVWAVYGDATFARLDPRSERVEQTFAGIRPTAVVEGGGWVWVVGSGDSTVYRFGPATFMAGPIGRANVGRRSTGIAYGHGAVWVTSRGDDVVTRIDPGDDSTLQITVGDRPAAVGVGADAVWVANAGDGTVSRVDPATRKVVATIDVGQAPSGIAVANGLVWTTVQAP